MSQAADCPLRVAVIGCGKVAQNLHLPTLAKSGSCELVAMCDASPAVLADLKERYPAPLAYNRPEDLLRDPGVEAVLISVGDPLHVSLCLAALDAGKHVLVEKPLGTTAAECLPIRDAARRSGRKVAVGLMKRHDPGVQYARHVIAEDIGRLRSFSIWYRASADRLVDETSVFLPVLRDPQYRRPEYKSDLKNYYLLGHGVHLLDQLRYTMGEVARVQAALSVRDGTHSWHGLVRTHSGAIGNFELSVYVQSEWSEGLDAFGDQGSVSVRTPNPFFLRPSEVRAFDASSNQWRQPIFPSGDSYLRQLDAFARSVREEEPVCGDAEDGIRAQELIEAVASSVAENGAIVEVRHE